MRRKVADIAKTIGVEVVEPTPTDGPIRLTELGNARRIVREHGADIRCCSALAGGGWLLWDGERWKPDQDGAIFRRAKAQIEEIRGEARRLDAEAATAGPKDEKARLLELAKTARAWAKSSEKAATVRATLEHLRTESSVPVRVSELDADPWLLGTTAGTVDLRTGEVRAGERADLITRRTAVPWDAEAECPTWSRFLLDVMDGSEEMVSYLQRAVGYSLIGVTEAQAFFVLHGTGANGKSTFVETLRYALGDYATNCPPESFVGRKDGNISNDLARLVGARFVTAAETAEGKPLDEALVKAVTGGEPITTRYLRKEFFEFAPQFTLWLSTNHKPRVKGTDHGIWRRIRLVPFNVTISEQVRDARLPDKLRAEAAGILRWAVQGAVAWGAQGLDDPEIVLDATDAYRTEQDVVAAFMEACCEIGPGATALNVEVYKAFKDWTEQNGEYGRSHRWLSQQFKSRGFEQAKSGARFWRGFALIDKPVLRREW